MESIAEIHKFSISHVCPQLAIVDTVRAFVQKVAIVTSQLQEVMAVIVEPSSHQPLMEGRQATKQFLYLGNNVTIAVRKMLAQLAT